MASNMTENGDRDSEDYALFDDLAAEFINRYRKGERPTLKEYIERCPDLADEIRDLFPAMVDMEQAEEVCQDRITSGSARDEVSSLTQVGDFRIIRRIGRGGMGVVYEAEQISLGRHVALKVLPSAPLNDPKVLQRFRLEARAAARLHHSNIVPVFEVGHDGDTFFYAMQFIPGQGLDLVIGELKRIRDRWEAKGKIPAAARSTDEALSGIHRDRNLRDADLAQLGSMASSLLLARDGAWSGVAPKAPQRSTINPSMFDNEKSDGNHDASSEVMIGGSSISTIDSSSLGAPFFSSVANIGRQAAQGLAYAHARGVIHRDIKPSNLLLDTEGVVWITDFGLAKAGETNLTAPGDILGTIRYMAPERFRGEGDARCDVYALGLSLYELATMRPAFEDSDRLRLVELVKSKEPPRPRAIDPRIPRDLETIILKAIEKDPRRRYAGAAEMAEDLRRFIDREPIRARQVGEIEKVWKWAMRSKGVAALILLAVGSMVAGTAASLRLYLQARHFAEVANNRAREAADSALKASRIAADARISTALAAAEVGEVDRGVFGLIDALELAPDLTPEDAERRFAIRRNIAGWMSTQPVLRQIIPDVMKETKLLFLGEDRMILGLVTGQKLRKIDLKTGLEISALMASEFPEPILDVSPDASLVVTCAPIPRGPADFWSVSLYDGTTGQLRHRLPDQESLEIPPRIVFDPETRYIGVCNVTPLSGKNRETRRCKIWRLDPFERAGPEEGVWDFEDRPSVRLIAVKGGTTVLIHPDPRNKTHDPRLARLHFWNLDQNQIEPKVEPSRGPLLGRNGLAVYSDGAFDGTSLVTVTHTGEVTWNDPATGLKTRPDWRPQRAMASAAFAGDGRTLVVRCDDDRFRYYDLARGRECGPVSLLASGDEIVCPVGSLFLGRRGDQLAVWQLPGSLRSAHPNIFDVDGLFYRSMTFSDSGDEYILGDAQKNGSVMGRVNLSQLIWAPKWQWGLQSAHRFSTEDGRPLGPPLHPLSVHPVFSPDGRFVASCRTETIRRFQYQPPLVAVWERSTGKIVMPWTIAPQFIHSLAFSPDGNALAVGCVAGTFVYEISSENQPRFLAQPGPITRIEYSRDGRRLAAGSRSGWDSQPGVRIWEPTTGRSIGPFYATKELPFFRFKPEGDALLVIDGPAGKLVKIRTDDGSRHDSRLPISGEYGGARTLDGDEISNASVALEIRPDGKVLATCATSNVVKQFEVDSTRPIGLSMSHPATVVWLAYSSDNSTLASACVDGTVRLWDSATGQPIGPPLTHGLPIFGLRFNPDSSRLSVVTIDGKVVNWAVPKPVPIEEPAMLRVWAEAISGLQQKSGEEVTHLSLQETLDRRREIAKDWPEALPGPDYRGDLAIWSQERAEDAQRSRDSLSLQANLDMIVALKPDAWLSRARRAAVLSDAEQFEAASDEYERAAKLTSEENLFYWYWYRGVVSLITRKGRIAAWYLDRVVALQPSNWLALAHRAEVHELQGEAEKALELQDRTITFGADPGYVAELVADRAVLGDWEGVDAIFRRRETVGSVDRAGQALARLKLGDREFFRHEAEALIADLKGGRPMHDEARIRMALILAAAPGVLPSDTPAQELLKPVIDPDSPRRLPRWIVSEANESLAAILLRMGKFHECLKAASGVNRKQASDSLIDIIEALALANLGDQDRAIVLLRAIRKENPYYEREWERTILFHTFRNEAEEKILDPLFPSLPFAH